MILGDRPAEPSDRSAEPGDPRGVQPDSARSAP